MGENTARKNTFITVTKFVYLPLSHIVNFASNSKSPCGVLSTLRNLRELLSGLVSINTTQILQAREQMECDNNEH